MPFYGHSIMNNWSYSKYRATLKRDGKFFALVTHGSDALPPTYEHILMDALCQTKLANLQSAVREHATEMDALMKGPSTYERGQKIALSLGKLEQSRRDSESTSPRPAPKSASGSSTNPTLPLSKAGAMTRPAAARPTSSASSKPSKRTTSRRSITRRDQKAGAGVWHIQRITARAHDKRIYARLLKLKNKNPGWEMVYQEPASAAAPEWTPVVPGTMMKLSDGSLAYLFDAGPPVK